MSRPFRILAIDGGGIRGVFAAHILRCIETRLELKPLDYFDMIAGTSTGSILAGAVAIKANLDKVVELYKKDGPSIFSPRMFIGPRKYESAYHSRYNKAALSSVLSSVFGNIKLGQISVPLLIPATDIGNGNVHVFKSGYSNEFTRDRDVFLKDAILASCSAPTYFDPAKVKEYLLADGGLWANNPALAATIDAKRRLGRSIESIAVLSVGTGSARTCYGVKSNRKWGFINGWKGRSFIDFLTSVQAQSTNNYLQLLLPEGRLLRLNFESDCPLPLDDCSAIDDLISNADRIFTHKSQEIQSFLTKEEVIDGK